MKKLMKIALFWAGWGLAIYLMFNPTVRKIYTDRSRLEIGDVHVVELGNDTLITFRVENTGVSWKTAQAVTVGQFRQYQLNHPEELICGENPDRYPDCTSPYTAIWVTWEGATGFCEWLTWRETISGVLPEGYSYSAEPITYRKYNPYSDIFYLDDGFNVFLEKKKEETIHPLLVLKLLETKKPIDRFCRVHPSLCHALMFVFFRIVLPMGFVCWVSGRFIAWVEKDEQASGET